MLALTSSALPAPDARIDNAVITSKYAAPGRPIGLRTQTLAGELAPLGVRVNSIAASPVDTPIHAAWAEDLEEAYRWLRSQFLLRRIGTPQEVAQCMTLLLSPAAGAQPSGRIPDRRCHPAGWRPGDRP